MPVNFFKFEVDTVVVPLTGTMLYNMKLNTYDTSSGSIVPTNLPSDPLVNLVDSYDEVFNDRVSEITKPGTGQYRWFYESTAGDGLQSFRANLSNAPNDFRATRVFTAVPQASGVSGPGTIQTPIQVLDKSNNPVSNANVWITTDQAGSNVIAGTLTTKYNGITDPFLLWPGTYYYWAQKYGILDAQGIQFTVT